MKVYLKIKIMSLAAEARIIRKETKRWPGESAERLGLYHHRIEDVRSEARSGLLAYGFLRGRPYRKMEALGSTVPDWKRVEALITKYGDGDLRGRMQRFSEWKEAIEPVNDAVIVQAA